jgi:hypothetical protein
LPTTLLLAAAEGFLGGWLPTTLLLAAAADLLDETRTLTEDDTDDIIC